MNTRELELSGLARDYGWIFERYTEGKLHIAGIRLNKQTFEQLKLIVRLANEIYENSWDLDVIVQNTEHIDILGLVVHFPEVIIRNRDNKRHTIKDLFIKLPFNIRNNNLNILRPRGGRTTWTYAEWTSGYSHSHLSGINQHTIALPFFADFCTGSGHINDYIAQINAGEFNEELVTSLLVQLMGLASYESIEGTPYRYMSSIYNRNGSGGQYSYRGTTYKMLYDKLITAYKETGIIPKIDFGLETGKYFVKDNEVFDTFLTSIPFNDQEKRIYLCYVDNTGQAWSYGASPNGNLNIPNNIIPYIFRNEEKNISITNRVEQDDNIVYKIHPTVKEQIKQHIEYEINRKKIRKSTIDRHQNKVSIIRENTESDKVLV